MQTMGMGNIAWEKFRSLYYPFSSAYYIIEKEAEERAHHTDVHFHDFSQLLYCVDGDYTHTVGEEKYACGAGSLIIIPPGVPHSYTVEKGKCCIFIQVNLLLNFFDDFHDTLQLTAATHLFLHNFSKELKFNSALHMRFTDKYKLFADRVFTALSEHDWSNQINSYRGLRDMFFTLFALPCFSLPEKTLSRALNFIKGKYISLVRTVYYMNLNYSNKISVDELTELSGLCRTHYFRYIRKALGCTYSYYLQFLRVSHAAMLCKFSRYTFSYIADICGFGNQAYMNDRMKKLNSHWKTPGEMRRDRQKQISRWPDMIMSRGDYEKLSPHFHAFGL